MITFRVTINNEPVVVAGHEDLSVLSSIVSGTALRDESSSANLHLHLGGLTGRGGGAEEEFFNWMEHRPLKVGDRVELEIVEGEASSPIENRKPGGTHGEKEFFEQAKKIYLDLREKYESES